MSDAAVLLEMLAVLLAVPAGYAWLGVRARRRGIGVSVMAPLEEMYDPVSHRTNVEMHVQAERSVPAPAPGDPPRLISRRRAVAPDAGAGPGGA